MNKCNWPLGNGKNLEFTVYDSNNGWKSVAGLYIFSYYDGQYWRALYVGQTDDFSARLPSHERLNEAVKLGATHIQALTVPRATDRDDWERMLIQHLKPRMNSQLR